MKFPWTKPKTNPVQDAITSMKTSMLTDLQSQLMGGLSMPFMDVSNQVSNAVVTMLGGTKVKVVKTDPKKDKEEQDRLYNNLMSYLNGDRDVHYPHQQNIEIKAFTKDFVSKADREDIIKILDIINEASDINRDGVYREDQKPCVPNDPAPEPEVKPVDPIANTVAAFLQPTIQVLGTVCSYMLAIVIMSNVGKMMDKL